MKKTVAVLVVFLLCAGLSACKREDPQKKEIFGIIESNEALLNQAVGEIEKLDDSVYMISSTYVRDIEYNAETGERPDIEGLYVWGARDGTGFSEALDNAVLEKVFQIKGILDIVPYKDGTIEFDYKGTGSIPESMDYGFYYSADDQPVAMSEGTLLPNGSGWVSEEPDSEIWAYVEKIRDHWYYFLVHS